MASKKTVTPDKLVALGAERLAAILVDLADGDAEVKRRLRLELAAEAGGDTIAAEIGKRITALRSARSYVDWPKRRDFVRDTAALMPMNWREDGRAAADRGASLAGERVDRAVRSPHRPDRADVLRRPGRRAGGAWAGGVADTERAFAAAHERLYGFRLQAPVRLVTVRVEARGVLPAPVRPALPGTGAVPSGEAMVHWSSGSAASPVYDRAALGAADRVDSPAIVNPTRHDDARAAGLGGRSAWHRHRHPPRHGPAAQGKAAPGC